MEVYIDLKGVLETIHDDDFDLRLLGPLSIRRASHVEPDDTGQWHADLSPVKGPKLGPFLLRREALAAEREWLERHHLGRRMDG